MAISRNVVVYFILAAVLRILIFLFAPSIPDHLSNRVEISTPITSYKRLREGLFLYERGAVSPYDGGVYHQAPLLLVVFSIIPDYIAFTALDLLNAWNIYFIASRLSLPSPRFTQLDGTKLVAAYLFNPFTILSCLGRSTNIFTNASILQATAAAISGNGFGTAFALATGTYFSLYPSLLLPPLLLLWSQSRKTALSVQTAVPLILIFLGTVFTLLAVSLLVLGPTTSNLFDLLRSCYLAQITVTDLTPNVGLWWYFFIEIFDAFRSFFIGVFWTHLIGYVGAFTVRLPDQPLFVIISLCGLFAVFKPYPSISDVSLYLGVLPLYKHIFPLTRYSFLSASVLLYATLLGPAFYHIWIYAGSGNANFFYAITLVWSLGLSMIVGDSLFAVLRDEAEVHRPDLKGQEVRQI